MSEPTLFGADRADEPLASRMRPATVDQVLGQDHLLGPGKPIRAVIDRGDLGSMILWGPPGSGKTTIARLLSQHVDHHFVPFSAVTDGVPRVREIIKDARERRSYHGHGTVLFCDEIHRFNKAQQDAFLPVVEEGVITLIGATTENPSFAVNSALLSRVQVFVLEALPEEAVREVIANGLKRLNDDDVAVDLTHEAVDLLVRQADGDARQALNALEAVGRFHGGEGPVDAAKLETVLARRMPTYDRDGEQHYNLISALHKAVRGSDVEGSLYWLARMLDAGEDPLYVSRRVVRMAAEDTGLADPRALSISLAAMDTFRFLGSPEGELAIAEAVVYLATAPKSNRVYRAWKQATAAAREFPNEPVPMHIRNAPTGLMKKLGYGKGYRYDPDEEGGLAAGQTYLPDALDGAVWYEPADLGFEKTVAERLAFWARLRERADHPAHGGDDGE